MNFDKIKEAVNSIEMSKTMKSRVKKNCNIIEKKNNFKGRISVACAFGFLLLIMIGIPLFNNNGNFQVANFTITAYAVVMMGISQIPNFHQIKLLLNYQLKLEVLQLIELVIQVV